MEKLSRILLGIGTVIALVSIPAATAGTALMSADKIMPNEQDADEGKYPESQFKDLSPAQRNPAGLEMEPVLPKLAKEDFSVKVDTASESEEDSEDEEKIEQKKTTADPQPAEAALKKGFQEIALIVGELGFFPKTVFVNRDVPVRMFVTGASKGTLCIMMDSFQVRKQVRSQRIEEITFTPSTAGQYRFYCPINGAQGTVIVKEVAAN